MPIDPLVQSVLNRTEPGRYHHDTLVQEYDRAYAVYRAGRKRNSAKPAWESDLRVPYAQQIVDTMLVNIIGGKPRFRVRPRRPEDTANAESMQIALDYFVYRDHLGQKRIPFVQQGLIYGGTVAKNQWAYREAVRRSNQFVDDPFTGQQLRLEKAEKVLVRDGPTFEPWDIYDAWWEPNARDVESAAYFVLRSWLTKDEVLAHRRSDDNPFGMFQNVDDLLAAGTMNVPTLSAQESYIGSAVERRKDRFCIEEVWTDDGLTVMGNRQVLLRHIPNPFWHNQKPIVFAAVRPDLFQLQGIPEPDLVADIQQALWTIQNARLDNLHLTVHTGITYRESGVTDPNSLIAKPRFKWAVQDHDDVKAFDMPNIPAEAWREDEKLLSQIQLISGVNPYISGADLGSVDQNTATGVTALQNVASQALRFKAMQIAYGGDQHTGEQWGQLIQQFLSTPMQIRIEGEKGYRWKELDPQQIVGDFDVEIEGVEESLSRQQVRGEVMGLLNALAPFAALGIVNMPVLLRKVGEAYDFPNPDMLIQKPQPQPAAAPAAPTNGASANGAQSQTGAQPEQGQLPLPGLQQAAGQMGGLRLG